MALFSAENQNQIRLLPRATEFCAAMLETTGVFVAYHMKMASQVAGTTIALKRKK
jgi:hypothetical protein